jgi:anthranilate phosphoribosyltransferase
MAIGNYIKEIGRGKDGARALDRAQAADLFGQVLDGSVTDLEIGAFCLAMRIKGETALEMAGFLDATYARMARVPVGDTPVVSIPTYNGARKLPVLTPLLALLLAREGLPVLLHGTATESSRVFTSEVIAALDIPAQAATKSIANGEVQFVPTAVLCPGLQRLLDVRRVVHLRNPAHSLVKLMNPCAGKSLVVSSYTHPEYAISMAETFALMHSDARLIRGTEGEAVADPRRTPKMQAFLHGQSTDLLAYQSGSLTALPDLPQSIDAASTAAYIRRVLEGTQPVPAPIAQQVAHILHLVAAL